MTLSTPQSVFYQLNSTLDTTDKKRKNQINPPLRPAEIEAIYNSFIIRNPHQPVYGIREGNQVFMTFQEAIKEAIYCAADCPTARIWLRRLPAGITLTYSELENFSGYIGDEGIQISPLATRTKEYLVCTLIHELAHEIDRRGIMDLSLYPFREQKERAVISSFITTKYTENEARQIYLIEEAEKIALSKQLQYELNIGPDLAYQYQFESNYKHYAQIFSKWRPSEKGIDWQPDELQFERDNRAFCYATMRTMTESMREFLRPYPLTLPNYLYVCKNYDIKQQTEN